ncbi:M15 family metallopeptidase [Aerococcaceae bacterium zg-ZJ1578]|uniref:M15 family metallopeptidase n=1 Tax=Aerococcaceae TaxID=186827 RepID=UPI0013D889A4|nr:MULTISPECIES: M15 family metallopeptidase [unclassified Facklamia]MBK0348384.1 M15 family metallopeptidase [Aerococcaceae bacterium zg-1578]MBS4462647.1 M15 family metallopeptidase [Aerococcaceae bacterium zg-B36]QQD65553.1 M15 family metallopeptidase [Aerococcaceae bacterium zg-252]
MKKLINKIILIVIILSVNFPSINAKDWILPKLDKKDTSIQQLVKLLPPQAQLDDPFLILINRENLLESEPYIPFVYASNGLPYHEALQEPLQQLFSAAEQDGFYYQIVSGYRSFSEQAYNRESRYYSYISEGLSEAEATYLTDLFYAPSNGSEHSSGLAVDLLGINWGGELSVDYQYDPSAIWLAENAHRFGFILRYLNNKTDITGINFEPWHFRYVGNPHATFMHEHQLTLEEYLALITMRNEQLTH